MKKGRRPGKHVRKVRTKRGKRKVVVNADVKPAVRRRVVREELEGYALLLKRKGRVSLPELGVLRVQTKKARPARMGVNPFTGERMRFKAKPKSRVVKFRPSKSLKMRVR